MNYYERHLGDYAKDTAHLSMLEHGAYNLLMDRYYATEEGIPADQAHRVARARTRDEKQAVDAVLGEFFVLTDGVWMQKRIDAEIAKFVAKVPAAEEKKENDKERQRRARERRKQLFEELSGHGINMPFNATTEQLITELSRVTTRDESQHVTDSVTRDNTCTQTPGTRHQPPDLKPISVVSVGEPPDAMPENTAENDTRKGELCKKLRFLGIDAAPHLAAWAEILPAFSDLEILAAAEKAREKKPGERIHLNYVLAIVKDPAKPKAAAKEPPWWSSNERMTAKGRELGIEPRPGEDWPQFRSRIDAKLSTMEAAA